MLTKSNKPLPLGSAIGVGAGLPGVVDADANAAVAAIVSSAARVLSVSVGVVLMPKTFCTPMSLICWITLATLEEAVAAVATAAFKELALTALAAPEAACVVNDATAAAVGTAAAAEAVVAAMFAAAAACVLASVVEDPVEA